VQVPGLGGKKNFCVSQILKFFMHSKTFLSVLILLFTLIETSPIYAEFPTKTIQDKFHGFIVQIIKESQLTLAKIASESQYNQGKKVLDQLSSNLLALKVDDAHFFTKIDKVFVKFRNDFTRALVGHNRIRKRGEIKDFFKEHRKEYKHRVEIPESVSDNARKKHKDWNLDDVFPKSWKPVPDNAIKQQKGMIVDDQFYKNWDIISGTARKQHKDIKEFNDELFRSWEGFSDNLKNQHKERTAKDKLFWSWGEKSGAYIESYLGHPRQKKPNPKTSDIVSKNLKKIADMIYKRPLQLIDKSKEKIRNAEIFLGQNIKRLLTTYLNPKYYSNLMKETTKSLSKDIMKSTLEGIAQTLPPKVVDQFLDDLFQKLEGRAQKLGHEAATGAMKKVQNKETANKIVAVYGEAAAKVGYKQVTRHGKFAILIFLPFAILFSAVRLFEMHIYEASDYGYLDFGV
jgi:hypothetical protein